MPEPGVYSFDPTSDPDFAKLPGLTEAPQQLDMGATNQANQITTQVDPWNQNTPPFPPHAPTTAQVAPAQPAQPSAAEEVAKLKNIIGNQGNTIGELRKLLGTLSERMTQQPQAQPIFASTQPVSLFQGREPGYYPTAAEIQQAVVTAGDVLYNSITQRLEDVAVQAQLSQAGVTLEEAALMRLEFPSLSRLPSAERQAIINSVVKARRTEASAAQASFAQAASQTAQAGVRQQVYVPQPQPVSNVPQDGAQINIDAFGQLKNANEMEKALRSMGIGRVQDFQRRG